MSFGTVQIRDSFAEFVFGIYQYLPILGKRYYRPLMNERACTKDGVLHDVVNQTIDKSVILRFVSIRKHYPSGKSAERLLLIALLQGPKWSDLSSEKLAPMGRGCRRWPLAYFAVKPLHGLVCFASHSIIKLVISQWSFSIIALCHLFWN